MDANLTSLAPIASPTFTGNATFAAPVSGTTLTVKGLSGFPTTYFTTTGTDNAVHVVNGTDINNASYLSLRSNATETFVSSTRVGTGTFLPFSIYTSSTSRVSVGTAGNVTINAPSSGTALTVNAGTLGGSIVTSSNIASQFTGLSITNTNAAGYAQVTLTSNGLNKQFRVDNAGNYQIVNNAGSVVLYFLADNGAITTACTAAGATATFTGNQASALVTSQNTGTGYAAFSMQSAASQPSYMFFNTTGFGETARLQAGSSGSLDICTNTAAAVRLSISSVGAVTINAPSSGVGLTVAGGGASITGTTALDATSTVGGLSIGYRNVPQSANTTAATTDVGKCIVSTGSNIAIPNSIFVAGDVVTIYNNSAGTVTITAGITTMRLAGSVTTGNRALAARGMASVYFISGTECVVSGAGVS
jgi:hypothetical protein